MSIENTPENALTPKRRRGRPRKIRPLTGVITPAILREILLEKASSAGVQLIDTVVGLLKATKTIVVQAQGKTEVLTVPDHQTRLGAARLLGEWLGFCRQPKVEHLEPPIIEVRTQPSFRPVSPPSPPPASSCATGDEPGERQEHLAAR